MRYPIPAVSAAIFNPEGKLLLTLRSSKVNRPHEWCLPGGHLDGGSTWVESLRKEVAEEVGLRVISEKIIGIYSDPAFHVIEIGARKHHYLTALFCITAFAGEVAPNEEVDSFGWYDLQSLPRPLLKSETVKIQDAFHKGFRPYVR